MLPKRPSFLKLTVILADWQSLLEGLQNLLWNAKCKWDPCTERSVGLIELERRGFCKDISSCRADVLPLSLSFWRKSTFLLYSGSESFIWGWVPRDAPLQWIRPAVWFDFCWQEHPKQQGKFPKMLIYNLYIPILILKWDLVWIIDDYSKTVKQKLFPNLAILVCFTVTPFIFKLV